jgi:hypothetical protein
MAPLHPVYLHFTLYAEGGLLKSEHHPLAQVAARLGRSGAASGDVAEEGIEDVAETARYVEALEGPVEATVAADPSVAVLIILGPFLGVGEDLISLVDLFELLFSIGTFVAVRVVLQRLFPEGFANFFIGIGSGDTQNFVIVSLRHEKTPTGQGT